MALHDRLGFFDHAGDFLRQLRAQRFGIIVFDNSRHAVLQERAGVAQQLGRDFDLVIGFHVHEHQHAVGFIQELLVFLLQTHAFDLVRGPKAFVQFRPVAQVAQFNLCKGAALAGLHMVDFDRGPQTAIMLQHVAGANFVTVDLGHVFST